MKFSFLKFKTNSFLKRNTAIRTSLPYKQALSVGVIFTVEDKAKHEEVKEFVRHLEHDGKTVKVISFLPKNKDNYEFMFDFFTENDLSFWGNINSAGALQFAATPFDFLYYLDTTPNPMIMNLIAQSKAKCRVGKFWYNTEPFFELMIESRNGAKSLIESMYRYTKALR
ncbi:MAG TPA: hypothetical protein VGD65_17215 [Chryseosolibacter sp.]